MPSIGDKATASAEKRVQNRLVKIYSKARKDMMEQMKEFNARFAQKDQEKRAKVKAGQMTQEDYDKWKRMQVLQSDIWRQKVEQATKTLEDANRQALRVINGEKMDVFAENANYEAYRLSKDTGIGYGFSVYDKDTVGKLIREQPELMPRKVVNGKKDRAWNRTKISNAVTQSIIQGDSLPEMTERIARETAHENDAAMARYAATAMTSAQNAGRMETMERAKGMGIKVRKKWIATLDARTRDSHAELDGQVVDIDEPFITHNRDGSLAEIMFPGDPQADGEQVWNCRCTLGYVYEEYPDEEDAERISAEYYRDEDDNLRSRPSYVKNMSYSEWKKTMQIPPKQKTTQEENGYSFSNMPRSMGTDEYDQWAKSHSTRATAKEDERLLDDLWMAESNPGGIHYVQSADGSSAINGYWRNDGAITYSGKWDRTVRPGDKVPSKLQAIYEKDSKSIRETSEAMDRLIQSGRSDREMALERWSGADALKRLGIDIGSGKTQRFGHARITDGLNHQDIVDQINQTLKGAVISDKGYSSASVSSERNVFIGSDIKFTIIAPEGTPMYITENTAESEVILARKTEMEVIGARVIDTKARRDEWNGKTTEKKTKTVEILVKLLQ